MHQLEKQIYLCKKCPGLNCLKKKTLSAGWYGNTASRVIFYGSSVWWDWTTRPIPFASWSGRVIDHILQQVDLQKQDIYISNAVKCRLPNLRQPKQKEIENCKEYIWKELEIIQPDIIVPMGATATRFFLPDMEKCKMLFIKNIHLVSTI